MFILIKSILDFDSLHIASIFLIHRSIEKYISYMRKNKTTVDVFYVGLSVFRLSKFHESRAEF